MNLSMPTLSFIDILLWTHRSCIMSSTSWNPNADGTQSRTFPVSEVLFNLANCKLRMLSYK